MGSMGSRLCGRCQGVLILTAGMGLKPGNIPIDVILIIMSVITAIAGHASIRRDGLFSLTGRKIIAKHPKQITFLAPVVTYFMTLFAGTGHTAFSTLPVIAEVAKEQGIRPLVLFLSPLSRHKSLLPLHRFRRQSCSSQAF